VSHTKNIEGGNGSGFVSELPHGFWDSVPSLLLLQGSEDEECQGKHNVRDVNANDLCRIMSTG